MLPRVVEAMNILSLNDPDLLRQQSYIDGCRCDADQGKSFPVTNPASGELLAQVPDMESTETRRAVAAAKAAWPEWRRKTAGIDEFYRSKRAPVGRSSV
jgi:succinate-semialdehyde dehydrogenase/glutarate-semialdehyde dehydrogenase